MSDRSHLWDCPNIQHWASAFAATLVSSFTCAPHQLQQHVSYNAHSNCFNTIDSSSFSNFSYNTSRASSDDGAIELQPLEGRRQRHHHHSVSASEAAGLQSTPGNPSTFSLAICGLSLGQFPTLAMATTVQLRLLPLRQRRNCAPHVSPATAAPATSATGAIVTTEQLPL